jgi:hypothetical protein
MRIKQTFLLILLFCTTGIYAQFGIKAGVNMANEFKTFSQQAIADAFSSKNLTGYQIGVIYQAMPKKSGLGCEFGALLSQKGSSFTDSTTVANAITQGYRELNYVEVPFNLRYRLTIGFIGVYGIAGIYGGYALSGRTVNEVTNEIQNETFQTFMDHVDYGYNLGAGLELFNKIQLGATWTQGIRNTAFTNTAIPVPALATNRVFSINLVYLF